jgi:putative chitinase
MSLKNLQTKIGVKADGAFGPATLKAAATFLKLSPTRAAHLFGQTAHETGEFKLFSENLNYSAQGLQTTFGKYFPGNLEESYARQPEKIANRVYASRIGNGDEASGDGWKYRGRGALQLTGKANYQAFADYLKRPDIMTNPDLVANDFAFESAVFFFDRNKLWDMCDAGCDDATITKVSKRVNGGTNGLDHRIALTKKYFGWLNDKY